MRYSEAKQIADGLWEASAKASAALQVFPRGAMGLVPDDVKATKEYQAASADYQRAASALRKFNGVFCRTFAKEIREERERRRAAMVSA